MATSLYLRLKGSAHLRKFRYGLLICGYAVLLLIFQNVSGQLPKVIPPAPETSALFNAMNIAVNNSKGVPNISIPIYEIKSGGISVPISLSYNAEGRKVFDNTGAVGLGWSLNVGGMISRTVYGKEDDRFPFPSDLKPSYMLANNNYADHTYLQSISSDNSSYGNLDTQYDIFSYFFGSQSGKFVCSPKDAKTYLLPQKPLKIEPFTGFPTTITDEKGIVYEFLANEVNNNSAVTSKSLTSITSANGTNITFTYQQFVVSDLKPYRNYTIIDDNAGPSSCGGCYQNSYPNSPVYNQNIYTVQRITEINFPEGKVKFLLDGASSRIKTIQVLNKNGGIVKTIELFRSFLDYSLYSNIGENLKLDYISFKDNSLNTIEKYSFIYEPSDVDIHRQDFWGYANSVNNANIVPDWTGVMAYYGPIPISSGMGFPINLQGGIRTSSIASKSGILKKIIYPTGGSAEFSYESNEYQYLGTAKNCGGLRVSEIKTLDNNGNIYYKMYKYGIGGNGIGTLNLSNIQINDMSTEKRIMPDMSLPNAQTNSSYRVRTYTENFLPEVNEIAGNPIFYPLITEYDGTLSNNKGKTEYIYQQGSTSTLADMPVPSFATSSYDFRGLLTDYTLAKRHVSEYNLWRSDHLLTTTYYKNTGTGGANPYFRIKSVSNSYTPTPTEVLTGTHVVKYIETPSEHSDTYAALDFGLPMFLFADYQITTGKDVLSSSTETDYTANGEITTVTEYTYNDNLLVSQVKKIFDYTTNKTAATNYSYPNPSNGAVYQQMINRNMLEYVTREDHYVNDLFKSYSKTNYREWGNAVIAPETVESKILTNAPEVRVHFHAYDNKGNVLSVSKENDVKTCYVWGYNKSYPMAQVTGSDDGAVNALINQSVLDNPTSTAPQIKAQFDNLRNGLASTQALVTTYTYQPLIGMTSQTDPNGRTTYYKYDAMGRLWLILDQDKNVVKKYCYKYDGQTANCDVFTNAMVNILFTKNDCSSGPGPVIGYPIAANTFFASSEQEANNMAIQEALNNGQDSANHKGICNGGGTPGNDGGGTPGNNGGGNGNISLHFSNLPHTTGWVYLFDVATGEEFYFLLDGSESGILGDIPAGTYSLAVGIPATYHINSCNYSSYEYTFYHNFYSTQFSNNCHNISINY